ncbi:MAG: hypothetical protein Q8867_06460 [Bacteroidota bacterium]|nr:hypothetical protein [Bacteroidota bacterium]
MDKLILGLARFSYLAADYHEFAELYNNLLIVNNRRGYGVGGPEYRSSGWYRSCFTADQAGR